MLNSFLYSSVSQKKSFVSYKGDRWIWGIFGGDSCLFYYESMDLNICDVF